MRVARLAFRPPRALLALSVFAGVTSGGLVWMREARAERVPAGDARAPIPVRLEVLVGPCADGSQAAELVESELRTRVARPMLVDASASAVVTLELACHEGSFSGTARFEGSAGHDERRVDGRSSIEVLRALAFIASAWIEAEPVVHASTMEVTPRGTGRPARKRPSHAGVARHAAQNPLLLVWRTGIALGFVSRPASEISGGAAYVPRGGHVELRAGLRLARVREASALGDTTYHWLTLPLDACAQSTAGALTAALCGRFDPGVFHTSIRGTYDFRATHVLAWLDAGAGVRVGLTLPARTSGAGPSFVRLEAEAFALVPVTGYRLDRDEASLAGFRTIAGSFAFGASLPIW